MERPRDRYDNPRPRDSSKHSSTSLHCSGFRCKGSGSALEHSSSLARSLRATSRVMSNAESCPCAVHRVRHLAHFNSLLEALVRHTTQLTVDRDEEGRHAPATSHISCRSSAVESIKPAFSTVRLTFILWNALHTHQVRLVPPALQILILLFYLLYHRLSSNRNYQDAFLVRYVAHISLTQRLPTNFCTLNVRWLFGLSTISTFVHICSSQPLRDARIPLACHAVRVPTLRNLPAFGLSIFTIFPRCLPRSGAPLESGSGLKSMPLSCSGGWESSIFYVKVSY
ncbi:hypothetical protein B0H14DRAFT_1409931 [Mycena olivaceomarginata]|nr:hypothetical protein B0H14DRAFT_1409931 [Mycena olivaceomarginata]